LLYYQNLQRKTNQKARKVKYEVLNCRNFKQNKLNTRSPSKGVGRKISRGCQRKKEWKIPKNSTIKPPTGK